MGHCHQNDAKCVECGQSFWPWKKVTVVCSEQCRQDRQARQIRAWQERVKHA